MSGCARCWRWRRSAACRSAASIRTTSIASRRGAVHQGVVGELTAARDYDVADLVREAPPPALLVVLDGIEDPHNFGAILRTADAAGAHGVIRQTRRSAALGDAAAKASAGAVAHVKIANVVNIARAVEELKELGVWTVGLAGDAPATYDQLDLTLPTALVLGAEGDGLRRLVRERCDFLMKIPMLGHIESLNVSVAAGIALFEAVRQRRPGLKGSLKPEVLALFRGIRCAKLDFLSGWRSSAW